MRMTGAHGRWLTHRHSLMLNASAAEQWKHTATWITAALARREKVYYVAGFGDPLVGTATRVADLLARASGPPPMEIVDGADPVETAPTQSRLYRWHLGLVHRARREGFRGAAVSSHAHTVTTLTGGRGRTDRLLAHERIVDQLTVRLPLRIMCRFNPYTQSPGALRRLLAVHFRSLDDSSWGADLIDGRLAISGELDTAERAGFRGVVIGAAEAGITTLDLSGVRLLTAAALGVLAEVANRLAASGGTLVLTAPSQVALRSLVITGLIEHPGLTVRSTAP